MSHFVARCHNYPEMKFNVPLLRPVYNADSRKNLSTWMKFTGGVFDTRAEEIPDKECDAIRKALERCAKVGANISFADPVEIPPVEADLHIGKEKPHGNHERR